MSINQCCQAFERIGPLSTKLELGAEGAILAGRGISTAGSGGCGSAFRVETEIGEVNGWNIKKAREPLAFLPAHGGTPVLRDTVAEALWPDGDVDQLDHQLSNAAYYLRRRATQAAGELDGQVLFTASQRYILRPGPFRVASTPFDGYVGRAERLQGYEALVEDERRWPCTAPTSSATRSTSGRRSTAATTRSGS